MYVSSGHNGFLLRMGALLTAAIGFCGCASPGGNGSDLPERIEMSSYSFASPSEPRWLMASRSGDNAALVRAGRVDGETFAIEGARFSLSDLNDTSRLVGFVRDKQIRELPRPRFRIYEHDVSETQVDGAQCALSHIVTEDRDPGTGTNVATSMLVETVSMVCIHPATPGWGVLLNYTHRSFPEDRDRGFAAAATRLLQTLTFDPPN